MHRLCQPQLSPQCAFTHFRRRPSISWCFGSPVGCRCCALESSHARLPARTPLADPRLLPLHPPQARLARVPSKVCCSVDSVTEHTSRILCPLTACLHSSYQSLSLVTGSLCLVKLHLCAQGKFISLFLFV